MRRSSIALLLLAIIEALSADAQTLTPPAAPTAHVETVELVPGRNFSSLIFDTVPGVEYTVSTSDDLFNWTNLSQTYYGLGQQVVIPMIEQTGGSEPPPSNPDDPPVPSPIFVSLLMSRATSGGLILSFSSSDGSAPIVYPISTLTIPSEWNDVPLFVSQTVSGYSFAIFFSGSTITPPATVPEVSTADQAMIDAFTAQFPSIATEVQAHVQRVRSLPPAPAQSSGNQRFFRVTANPLLDSDHDGTPDWLEFAGATTPATPGGPVANPFNDDTNGDGIADGEQLDSDGDGTPDNMDASLADKAIDWQKNEALLFACFLIGNSEEAYQVNDQGIVLREHSIWKNGVSLALNPSDGNTLTNCVPYGLGDNGLILGYGNIDLPGDTGATQSSCLVTWPAGGGNPIPLQSGSKYLVPVGAGPIAPVRIGLWSDMAVNAEGKFLAYAVEPQSDNLPGSPSNTLTVTLETPLQVWQGNPGGAITSQNGTPGTMAWITDTGVFCGKDNQGHFQAGDKVFEEFYSKAALLPDGKLGAFGPPFDMSIQDGGSWTKNSAISEALDVSSEGRFFIRENWTVWHNGPAGVRNGNELLPGLPNWDNPATCQFVDTTKHGWTLAHKRENDEDPTTAMLALPLRLSTTDAGKGLDIQSAEADNSSVFTPAQRHGNKDEFWVMIPPGGTFQVTVRSGASTETPVSLGAVGGILSTPPAISSPEATVTLSAPASAAGQELPVSFKIGSLSSSSTPLKAKIMKARVVKLEVHPISRFADPGVGLPTKTEMESYLNGIFQPQINATFNVVLDDWNQLPSEVDLDGNFYATDPPVAAQNLVASAYPGSGNIEAYVIDGFQDLSMPGGGLPANGFANPSQGWVWLSMNHLSPATPAGKERWLNTLAHEIGHVMVGIGHPDDEGDKVGPASLPGTDRTIRLMRSGLFLHGAGARRRALVKAEWDEAEGWLIRNVDIDTPPQ